jgi:hypothetical protein
MLFSLFVDLEQMELFLWIMKWSKTFTCLLLFVVNRLRKKKYYWLRLRSARPKSCFSVCKTFCSRCLRPNYLIQEIQEFVWFYWSGSRKCAWVTEGKNNLHPFIGVAQVQFFGCTVGTFHTKKLFGGQKYFW